MGRVPKPVPNDVCGVQYYGCQASLVPGHAYLPVINAPPSPPFKTTNMHMSNGKPKLCDSWNLLGKLVGRGGFQASVWLYAHLGP